MKNRLFMKCSSYLVLLTFTCGILALPINASAEWRTNSSIKEDNDSNKKAILISIGAVLAVMGVIYAIKSGSKKESEAIKKGELKKLELYSGRASATLDNNFIIGKFGQRNYFKIPHAKHETEVEFLISHQAKRDGAYSESPRKRFTLSWDDWRILSVMAPQKNKRNDVEDSKLFDEEVFTMYQHHFVRYDISLFDTYFPSRY